MTTAKKDIQDSRNEKFEKPEHAAHYANRLCEEYLALGWTINSVSVGRGAVLDRLPWICHITAEKRVETEVPS